MSEATTAPQPIRSMKSIPGARRASMLLVALGTKLTAAIMQELTPDEIERLTLEIVQIDHLSNDARNQILEECGNSLKEVGMVGGPEYARRILEQAVGETKAAELLVRVSSPGSGNALRWLRSVPPHQLAQRISTERPQVVALVLGHLSPEQTAAVIAILPKDLQGEVALRLTGMQPTDPEIVNYVADVLLQKLSMTEHAAFTEVGGLKPVIQILNNVDRTTEKNILEYLEKVNEEVANEVKAGMVVFEDILALEGRSIQIILRDVPQEDLRLALRGATEATKEIFFTNMSQRAAESLKDDLESSSPVRKRDVEAAQGRIAAIARQLDQDGEISLREGADEVVV